MLKNHSSIPLLFSTQIEPSVIDLLKVCSDDNTKTGYILF